MSRSPDCDFPEAPAVEGTLEKAVIQAVAHHLRARNFARHEDHAAARKAARAALAAWRRAAAGLAAINPPTVTRAHAHHARLASRQGTAFRELARKQLLELAGCARLKTESVLATITAIEDRPHEAAARLDAISRNWRDDFPVRLPGLRSIELAAADWYRAGGDAVRAQVMAERAATVSGVLSAYPEDRPAQWSQRPGLEELMRFAFAACRLADPVEAYAGL
jgi:hypothetical protein